MIHDVGTTYCKQLIHDVGTTYCKQMFHDVGTTYCKQMIHDVGTTYCKQMIHDVGTTYCKQMIHDVVLKKCRFMQKVHSQLSCSVDDVFLFEYCDSIIIIGYLYGMILIEKKKHFCELKSRNDDEAILEDKTWTFFFEREKIEPLVPRK
ncbi:hypothetical protein BCR42DRAFT_398305 [Absidia repens]|uniref:Uncharacterized protein n=1 Tax=Absidia repens TaxID=90262 RepID=A0A1X2HY51_9FUNG|nr:hypothetical protein BCR42DRAFT_398305 [Absidia repens]